MQAGNRKVGPAQMDAHQPGKHHPHQNGDQGQGVILLPDDFVVQAEDMLPR